MLRCTLLTSSKLPLDNGDLLLMEPPTQLWWQQERLNLTFRVVR